MKSNQSWGRIDIVLDQYMKARNISKNFLTSAANLQYTQLLAYCRNEVQRPDLLVLARICTALDCDISDILKYTPLK
jgi:putative transcriptional regulator